MRKHLKAVTILLSLCAVIMMSGTTRAADLSYLFMPSEQQGGTPSMLVMMHGYGANEQDFNDFPVIVPGNMIVVSLRAPLPVAGDSYQWYRNSATEAQAANDVKNSRQEVVATVKTLQQQYHISPAHTYIGGFSQGAVMTYAVALHSPQLFHGAVIFSGRLPAGFKAASLSAQAMRNLHIFVGHGEADNRIPFSHAKQAVGVISQWVPDVTFKTYPSMGHTINLDEIKDFRQWLLQQEAQ